MKLCKKKTLTQIVDPYILHKNTIQIRIMANCPTTFAVTFHFIVMHD